MKSIALGTDYAGVYVGAALLAISPAIADQPSGATGDANAHRSKKESIQSAVGKRPIFGERHRAILADYYGDVFRAGSCPSGLDKKRSGCIPPAQVRTWAVGRQLPPDVVYHDVPRLLAVQFGQLPSGQGYVRVARDILVIEIGSRMVVDALRDLERI